MKEIAMTMVDHVPDQAGVIWSCVEDGFYVGSCDGNFLGYVDELSGDRFAAYDAHSKLVGTYPELGDARRALSELHKRTEAAT
jgi:hypothetical protein